MPGSARKFTATGVDRGRSLGAFLAERLELSSDAAAHLIRSGAVYVDRRRVEEPDRMLQAGERIAAHLDRTSPRTQPSPAGDSPEHHLGAEHSPQKQRASSRDRTAGAVPTPESLQVRYRDRSALVVDKPAGMPTQATRDTVAGVLDRLVQEREPGARLVHRLDREASGLVLFSRTASARRHFASLLAQRALARIYTAVVWGHVADDEGHLDAPIGPDPRDRRRMAAGVGRPAETHYKVVRRGCTPAGHPSTLVQLALVTGRTHQIRVHMAHAGHPLCGDARYAAAPRLAAEPIERLCLHATELGWPDVRVRSPAAALFDALVLI